MNKKEIIVRWGWLISWAFPLLCGAMITLPAGAVTFTADTAISAVNTTYDGDDVIVRSCTVTIDGHHTFKSLWITDSGKVTHSVNADVQAATLFLTVNGAVTIDVNCSIDVSGRGFSSSHGPGAGKDWFYASGAGYGGRGGRSSNRVVGGEPYGSIIAPSDMGSGGGRDDDANASGGAGGGLIHLEAGGTLTINGAIRANGLNGSANESGGGAGGGIWIVAGLITGNGVISANGGNGSNVNVSGGGGGGRIALYYNSAANYTYVGTLTAFGGAGYYSGGSGTIFRKPADATYGNLLLASNTSASREPTVLNGNTPVCNLKASAKARVEVTAPLSLAGLELADKETALFPPVGQSLVIDVLADVTIRTDSVITANGCGFPSSEGPGAGADSYYASGAGHGGLGGASNSGVPVGLSYGSIIEPTTFGSGGGYDQDAFRAGGAGGGAIRLTVGGVLTVNGSLTADGTNGVNESGGGSGGSVWVNVKELLGNGTVSANGGTSGNTSVSGGGAGGRLAIYYSKDIDSFNVILSAVGGNGAQRGGAGTMFIKQAGVTNGSLMVDARGNSGAATPLSQSFWPVSEVFDLFVQKNAIALVDETVTFSNLTLESSATLSHSSGLNRFDVTVLHNANVKSGCTISADGTGYASSKGPGAGEFGIYAAGGAYGGNGGYSSVGLDGGRGYGDIADPNLLGSGGGLDNYHGTPGGAGGGALHLVVGEMLTVNGAISANGNNGANYSGGGAGGSVNITAVTLNGNGAIRANGGDSGNTSVAGGGGGGRIALYYGNKDLYDGTITAFGGNGYVGGGAGTIYLKDDALLTGGLWIQGNRSNRASTLLNATTPEADVVVTGAAWAEVTAPLTLASVLIDQAGSRMTPSLKQPLNLIVRGHVNIRAGTSIDADGFGFISDEGPGAGEGYFYAGGGGYGGKGGDSTNGALGGLTYGSYYEPTSLGSGGGFDYWNGASGGAGGGAIRMFVYGTLTVNGVLSADGLSGSSYSGGGAGGSIWLHVGTINGNGIITADGGNGGNTSVAGGGGGGRIAIYTHDRYADFSRLEVLGGTRNGQPGTVYFYIGFLLGDFNLDDKVKLEDCIIFAASWLDTDCNLPEWCHGVDLNRDGRVDFLDYSIFASQWGKCFGAGCK